jgi:hypothetical protein
MDTDKHGCSHRERFSLSASNGEWDGVAKITALVVRGRSAYSKRISK